MKNFKVLLLLAASTFACFLPLSAWCDADPDLIVKEAIDYWRGNSSIVEATMTVHRPEWERSSTMRSYTKGTDQSLVRFTAPARDAGNASLTLGNVMWSFVPRIQRTVKVPPSMMAQAWMGSDFSYRDLAREDSIVDEYTHRLLRTTRENSHTVYEIECIPKSTAAVVWGKEILRIRDDKILLGHQFFDQDMKLVKGITTEQIAPLGGKLFPQTLTMRSFEEPEHWTRITHNKAVFSVDIPESAFSLDNLRSPHEPFLKSLGVE